MNRHQFLLAFSCASVLTLSAFTLPNKTLDDRDTPYLTKKFSGGISAVRAETSGGSLTVEGGSGKEARVEMYVHPNNWNGRNNLDKDELEDRLKDYDISIAKEGSTLVATVKRRNNNSNDRATDRWQRSLSISFKFFTPRNVTTDLRTSGGSIHLSALTGNQRFRTSGGSLHLNDIEGSVNGQTSGGSIHADRIRQTESDGGIDLQTSGGSIEATASSGKLRLHTSGGSIKLADLKGDVDAQTSGGSVQGNNIDGDIKASTSGGSVRLANVAGSLDASTSAGSVEVSLTKLGEYVRLNTSAGSIRVNMPLNKGMDLNLSGNRVNLPDNLSRFEGNVEKDRVRGKLNGGGIAVNMTANSGSVSINR
ncbi:DUF4097 family beta strand repeat-containing protein [Spirosoma sp. KUDC1026]|uniref:DUF4097 family beta strand repeat-containing protein n=1 Tax=Spirosoma sp. KUDC1026 TaxID=2745947 RepID=UPI00159B9166|nr:DUF4097 family beta strand repeat-containing protein [Spirosoma sp. KUDC1026]QKZ12802.1 DUF4097 family beta strand repeat protein [Spirosoma sp. KUDC1026]